MANFSKLLTVTAVITNLSTALAFPFNFALAKREDEHDHFPLPECPAYEEYAQKKHGPYSDGPLKLPFQRPEEKCRTFQSQLVDDIITDFKSRVEDPDLGRLFENCFPSTLDTTIRWHSPDVNGKGPRSFVITGDINAEWLRDSRNQLYNYQQLAPYDQKLKTLLIGAIHTQAEFVTKQPYCNAFQPPSYSGLKTADNEQKDTVKPSIDPKVVFECKYEIDSISNFFGLAGDYYDATKDSSFINDEYLKAVEVAYKTLKDMQTPTFNSQGVANDSPYTFQRETDIGSETLGLDGRGNPVNNNTQMVRSFFRPSDDACIYQFFIPGNALASVELKRVGKMLNNNGHRDLGKKLVQLSKDIEQSIWKYGTTNHPDYGKVFAFEVDGYGSVNIMDDANVPSLLALPDMGFVDANNRVYQNTRRMILSQKGNPYYLKGQYFEGIGGPHSNGVTGAWVMSDLLRIRTSNDDEEIKKVLELVKKSTDGLGLMHESIVVNQKPGTPDAFSRPWFAWTNGEFARTVLELADRKPHLIFKDGKSQSMSLTDFGKKDSKQ